MGGAEEGRVQASLSLALGLWEAGLTLTRKEGIIGLSPHPSKRVLGTEKNGDQKAGTDSH